MFSASSAAIIPNFPRSALTPLPYRFLALDLDGTLLDPAGRLPPVSAAVLRLLAESGVRLALASGRMTSAVLPLARALSLPSTLVTYNGAVVLEGGPENWSIRDRREFPADARDAVIGLCRSRHTFLNVYADGALYGYHPLGDFGWSRHYESATGARYRLKTSDPLDLPLEAIEKLLAISAPPERDRLHEEWSPLLAGCCELTKSNPEYLEFLPPGVSKASALESCMARSGLGPADLLAFGDAENDLGMLRLAGLGVGMGNATPGLRAGYGNFSRWTHAENGVARELCSIFGLDFAAFAAD